MVRVSKTAVKYGAKWTRVDELDYRREVERRFRLRTPPTQVGQAHWGDRVTRSEMRNWSLEKLGKERPIAWDLLVDFQAWYRRMARREDPKHPSFADGSKGCV